jgi:hypothetical protein
MTLSDVSLLGKKILVGVIVTLVPFFIITGGLWLTESLLGGHPAEKSVHVKQTKTTGL